MRRRAVATLALAALAAAAAPAHALVVSEDELAEKSLVVGLVLRGFSFLLGGEVLRPPFAPEDASPSAAAVFDLRPIFAWRSGGWKLVVHGQLTSAVRSHALTGALALGRGVAPPRLLPLRAELADDPTLDLTGEIDWGYAAASVGAFTITVGRQPITFGRARVWRPTDLIGTFALTEVDTEYKPGSDAVRVDWSSGQRTQLTLVAATGELEQDGDLEASLRGTTFLGQLKRAWDRGEAALLVAMVRRDAVAAVDAVWDTGSFEVHGEAVATRVAAASLASPVASGGDVVARAVVGATFRPASKLTVAPELLYNGFGARHEEDYLAVAQSERVAVGEQILLGRAYAAVTADWELHPLLRLSGVALVNLLDPSALFSVALSYSVSDNVQALVGGYVPAGARPASVAAAGSEYGLYPLFGFVELKAAM